MIIIDNKRDIKIDNYFIIIKIIIILIIKIKIIIIEIIRNIIY